MLNSTMLLEFWTWKNFIGLFTLGKFFLFSVGLLHSILVEEWFLY